MASYTIRLDRLCELYTRESVESWFKSYKLEDYLLPEQLQLLQNSPIWSKDRLAKKIVDHYYMSEIRIRNSRIVYSFCKNYNGRNYARKVTAYLYYCIRI